MKSKDKERDLSCPHPSEDIGQMVITLLVDAPCLEFKDGVLRNQPFAAASFDVVDLQICAFLSASFRPVALNFSFSSFSQLVLE